MSRFLLFFCGMYRVSQKKVYLLKWSLCWKWMPYYYAEPTGALLQHSNKAFKQRLDFKRYTFLRTRGFSIVIRHSLPTKASFQKVYFFLGHPVYPINSKRTIEIINSRCIQIHPWIYNFNSFLGIRGMYTDTSLNL